MFSRFRPPVVVAVAAVSLLAAPSEIGFSQTSSRTPAPEVAYYAGLHDDEFLTEWLVLGPFGVSGSTQATPDLKAQRDAFESLHLDPASLASARAGAAVSIGGGDYRWRHVDSATPIVDLDALFDGADYAAAYALAYIEAPEPRKIFLGLGSDDGIRAWLNGELVHDNWVPRAINEDDDVVALTVREGANTLLLKIQDIQGGWGFVVRPLGASERSKRLVAASAQGNLDDVRALLAAGTDPNGGSAYGLTPLQSARVHGREGVIQELVRQGANPDEAMPSAEALSRVTLTDLVEGSVPGMAVLVARDGRVLYQEGFGLASIEPEIPIGVETKFRIGSITKQFTAAAILRLREAGLISLNDPLTRFIPDFPRGDEVSIYQLLTHTSGIRSFTNHPQFLDRVSVGIESGALVDSIKAYGFDFEPGTAQVYNNSGYFLLGHIVENVSGMTFQDYLKTTFFEPLGMNETGIHHTTIQLEHEAMGHSFENDDFGRAIDWDMSWAGGAGAMYSTVGDLFKWNEAVFSGDVLTSESMELALAPSRLKDGTIGNGIGSPYGFGWMIRQHRGQREIGHGGGLHGFVSYLARLPEKDVTVAVLANSAPSRGINPEVIARDLLDYHLWEELDAQETFAVDSSITAEQLDDYIGRHQYPGGAVLTVTREGDQLYAQLTGQPRFEIFPAGADAFFWKVVDAQIRFVRGEDGEIVHGIHRQGGAELTVPRLEEVETIAIEADQLDEYVGRYQYPGDAVLTVTREGSQLYAQLTGQPQFAIYPTGEDTFIWRVVDARITFVRGADGTIQHGIHRQGGAEINVLRLSGDG